MRVPLQIGLVGIALLAMLGGCGGGSNTAARNLHALLTSECGSGGGAEEDLRALEAGVTATEREFKSAASGENKNQILRAMKENIGAVHDALAPGSDCARNVLRGREGRPPLGPVNSPPRGSTDVVIARRVGPEFEPGGEEKSASPCGQIGTHGVAGVWIVPHWSNCLRVAPGDRLAVFYPRNEGGAASVQVTIGGYEAWLAPGQKALIPGRIGSYLGEGSHRLGAAGSGFGSLIIVEPEANGS